MNYRFRSIVALSTLWSLAGIADVRAGGDALIIYDEGDNMAASLFHPGGWMPNGRGIALQNDSTERPHSGKTCIKFGFDPSANDWVGVYFLAGDSWGDQPGVNIHEMLEVKRGQKIVLSFWVRSDTGAFLECKVGGVNRGRYPDSVPFAKSTKYFKAGPEWTRREIDLTNADLTNLVGGFCVVTDKAHNRGKKSVWFYLDDIKIEVEQAPTKIEQLLHGSRWVAYSPTDYDPHTDPVKRPSDESIRKDLRVLRPYFDGLVTYGCAHGLERIPAIARELGFEGFIQGVWDPKSEGELANLQRLANRDLITGICIGNEGLDVRYDWSDLEGVMLRIRKQTGLPVTTTEQVEDYGNERLIKNVDFLFPNVHPLWHRRTDVNEAVEWLRNQLRTLVKAAAGKPILIKETGWPSAGGTAFTPDAQRLFWRDAMRVARELRVPVVMFEAFDVPWKTEILDGGNVGPHWGLFDSKRGPKSVVDTLPR